MEERLGRQLRSTSQSRKRLILRRIAAGIEAVSPRPLNGSVGILMYHRVVNTPPGVVRPTWNITPAKLRQQLEGLRVRGFEPVALSALVRANARGEIMGPRCFVVTFDDGYENFFSVARPILHALNVPATVFLTTAYLDRNEPFPFDDWTGINSTMVPRDAWRPMTLQQCKELAHDPLIEIGAHSHTHVDFRASPSRFERDLRQCLRFLVEQLSVTAPPFAFPFGIVNSSLTNIVRRAGFSCAVTTAEELVTPGSDPFSWGRFMAGDRDTAATLASCLGGWYNEARTYGVRGLHGASGVLTRLLKGGSTTPEI
jgi:peptidoglycan/xylan/chitin deacetylase (PgdA/CDA1 family)